MTTSYEHELGELGLPVPRCAYFIERKNKRCAQPPAHPEAEYCVFHGGLDLVMARSVKEFRDQLSQVALPIATQRLIETLLDPEAKEDVVVRAAFGIMDRCGLGPVAGLQVEATVTTVSPVEQLTTLLEGVRDRLAGGGDAPVIEGEVVES